MFLLSHYCFFRGQSVRAMELADLQITTLEDQGPSKCQVLSMVLGNGKTNQVNRKETVACARAKDAVVCAVGGLALYFFCRFQRDHEPFPDLSER